MAFMAAKATRARREVPAHVLGPRLILLLSVLALTLIGFVMIYSVSSVTAIANAPDVSQANAAGSLFDQIKFALIGVAAAFVLWKAVPYSVWTGPLLWVIWGVAIGLLVLTAALGEEALGAQRWLMLGPISLQPSEFAKIALVLMGARILFDFRNGALSVRGMFVQIGLLILVPVLFLYKTQSDLGTTLIMIVGVIAVMWMGEVPTRVVLITLGVCAAFAVVAIFFVGYRSDRMLFLNPWNDGENGFKKGYQIIHSFYAFSEGGLFGVGLGNSREKFLYLPFADTDFIFAIIGEELGMVGALVVMGLFLALLYAGMRIARSAPDNFGAMVAGSCTIMLVFQAFLNIGCVIGVLPTTGKPLPFISSGGSSLVATFILVGLILSVSQRAATEPNVYERRRDDLRVVRAMSGPDEEAADNGRRGSSGGRWDSTVRSPQGGSSGGIGWDMVSARNMKRSDASGERRGARDPSERKRRR